MSRLAWRALPWLIAAIAVTLALGTAQRAERERGRDALALAQAEAGERRWFRRADSLARVSVPQTAAAGKWRDRWYALPVRWDTLRKTDTIQVPVEVLVIADSAIRSCHVALATCEERVAAEREVTQAVRAQLAIVTRQAARPWTAAGLAYDLNEARWGAFVDRDWSRLRVGGSLTPGAEGLRVGVRIGIRW